MMKIKSQRKHIISTESVAMTDIVLNMFIFFFISFSLLYVFNPSKVQKINIKLPEAKNVSCIESAPDAKITLKSDGSIFLNNEPVSAGSLKRKLQKRFSQNSNTPIIIEADKSVQFRHVVSILDLANELGARHLSISALAKKD